MYWIESKNGRRQPRANAPRASIANLREVFTCLDRQGQAVAHAEFSIGEHLDINVPSSYCLNSLGKKTTISGNVLFMKRLENDIEHLARLQWGENHTWDEGTMGSWYEAVGITDIANPVDESTVEHLGPVFPNTSLHDIIARYRAQHCSPTVSIRSLICLALQKTIHSPSYARRKAVSPSNSRTTNTAGWASHETSAPDRPGCGRSKRKSTPTRNSAWLRTTSATCSCPIAIRTGVGRPSRTWLKKPVRQTGSSDIVQLGWGRPLGDWNTVSTDTRRIGLRSSTGVTLNAPSTRN